METIINDIKWYKINEDVEYSTDFDFFTNHQIRTVKSGNKYSFCSRLENKTFKIDRAIFATGT